MRTKWSQTVNRPEDVRLARNEFRSFLALERYDEDAAGSLLIIFGELLANACEHGRLPVTIELASNGKLEIHVKDSGTGIQRPNIKRPVDSIRGRGLEMIEKLGGRIAIAPPPTSTIVVTLRLPAL